MKKIFTLMLCLAACAGARAEGYQVNNLSSRQNGMAHVGTAMKLGSESIWFNPAAAVFQRSAFDLSAGVTGIASKATYTSLPDYTGKTPSRHFTSDNKISTPLYAYVNYKPLDWMAVGLAFNTPYGSTMNWGDHWAGAHLIQSINLEAYNLQPTVSFRLGKHLSLGAGLMMTWGNFDLSRAMLPVGADNPQNQVLANMLQQIGITGVSDLFALAGDRSIMSLGVQGDAKMAFGVNLGIFWDINEQWSLGFTYRSKLRMKVDSGKIDLRMIDDPQIAAGIGQLLPQLGLNPAELTSAVVATELPLPANLTWGVNFRPTPRWELAVDLQYVLWSAYDELDIRILDHAGAPVLAMPVSRKNYSNTLAVRIGAQYRATRWLTARMGMYADESPVSSDYLNPETPSMTKLAYTVGLSFDAAEWLAFDIAYGYVNSADPERTGSTPYTNSVLALVNQKLAGAGIPASQLPEPTTDFSGNYTARAHTFSLGVRVKF